MYSIQKTDCFVLRRQDFREFDRLYTVYTREHGKVSILARSSRKIKSKLSPMMETFGEVRINFVKGKIFNHLMGISTKTSVKNIMLDSERLAFISEIFSIFDKLIKLEERDDLIYKLLHQIVHVTEYIPKEKFRSLDIYFFWRLIEFLGYRPALHECALCSTIFGVFSTGANNFNSKVDILFNITDNIIICRKCRGEGIVINDDVLNSFRNIFNLGLGDFLSLEINNQLIDLTNKAKQIKLSEL